MISDPQTAEATCCLANRIDQLCSEAVRWQVVSLLKEEDREKPLGRSLYRHLLEQIANAAASHAKQAGINPDDFPALLDRGLAVISDIRIALGGGWDEPALDFWRHERSPLAKIRSGKCRRLTDRRLNSLWVITWPYHIDRLSWTGS